MRGELNQAQLKALKEFMKKLDMPPKKRQRLLWRIASHGLIVAAKRHAKAQQDPEGRSWKKRNKDVKRKMFPKLPKLLKVKEFPEKQAVKLIFVGGNYGAGSGDRGVPPGVVGYAHNHGTKITVNKSQLTQDKSKNDKPATSAQAKRLRALGYSVKKDDRWVKPSMSLIKELLTQARAELIIRKLSGKQPKESWTIELPSRVFLGASDSEFTDILARQLQAIEFGWNVNRRDIR